MPTRRRSIITHWVTWLHIGGGRCYFAVAIWAVNSVNGVNGATSWEIWRSGKYFTGNVPHFKCGEEKGQNIRLRNWPTNFFEANLKLFPPADKLLNQSDNFFVRLRGVKEIKKYNPLICFVSNSLSILKQSEQMWVSEKLNSFAVKPMLREFRISIWWIRGRWRQLQPGVVDR